MTLWYEFKGIQFVVGLFGLLNWVILLRGIEIHMHVINYCSILRCVLCNVPRRNELRLVPQLKIERESLNLFFLYCFMQRHLSVVKRSSLENNVDVIPQVLVYGSTVLSCVLIKMNMLKSKIMYSQPVSVTDQDSWSCHIYTLA